MAAYLLHNVHPAEECQALDEEYQAQEGLPLSWKGHEFFCTCPTGDHGAYVIAEGASAEDVLAQLPPKFRSFTRAISGEILELA
jgi:hypothetical protein